METGLFTDESRFTLFRPDGRRRVYRRRGERFTTKPYDAHDVHEWEENQCKVDELADQTRAIGFSQFLGECGDYDCLP
jgi:hypothetical protein